METEYIYIDGNDYVVDYTYTPASGDGWYEERIEASLDISSINGIQAYLLDNDLINVAWGQIWDRIHGKASI